MENVFFPSRRLGLWVSAILLLSAAALLLLLVLNPAIVGLALMLPWKLLIGGLLTILIVLVASRAYRLLTTRYILGRGGLALRWGLRREVIPMPAIQWIRPVSDFQSKLPLPMGRLPGMVFGSRKVPGLGLVEYAATDARSLLLAAASGKYYAISPAESEAFLGLYERLSELGSLSPYEARSESMRTLWKKIWQEKPTRNLLAGGLTAAVLVITLAFLLASSRSEITWITLDRVPSTQLFLFAFFSLFIWLLNAGVGLYFHLRGGVEKAMIYLFWAGSILVSLLLAAAMLILAL